MAVDPYAYLNEVLTRLPTQCGSETDQLLPRRWMPLESRKVTSPATYLWDWFYSCYQEDARKRRCKGGRRQLRVLGNMEASQHWSAGVNT